MRVAFGGSRGKDGFLFGGPADPKRTSKGSFFLRDPGEPRTQNLGVAGEGGGRGRYTPNPCFAWEKFCPVQLGVEKYIDWREVPENFEGVFAYNWSLRVGKIQ